MAKIHFVAFELSPVLLQWSESLCELRNDVVIWTSSGQAIPPGLKTSIQGCFKNWSVREALKLISLYFNQPPDLLHFIFSSEDSRPRSPQWILTSWMSAIRRPVVTTFIAEQEPRHWSHRFFLRSQNFVSFSSRAGLMNARREGLITSQQNVDVLTPQLGLENKVAANDSGQGPELEKRIGKYHLVPGPVHRDFLDVFSRIYAETSVVPVFLGKRRFIFRSTPYLALEGLKDEDIRSLVEKSSWIFLCFHDFNLIELLKWRALSIKYKVPLLVRPDQIELLPGLCRVEKTGKLILDIESADWARILKQQNLSWEGETVETSADSSINELTRLYANLR